MFAQKATVIKSLILFFKGYQDGINVNSTEQRVKFNLYS